MVEEASINADKCPDRCPTRHAFAWEVSVERSNDDVLVDALTGLAWRKSRRSNPSGNCVELALLPAGTGVAVRNSRFPDGPALVYTRAEIAAFLGGVLDGEFDDLLS